MFEFYGRLTEKCIKETSKRQNKYIALFMSFFTMPLFLLSILLYIFLGETRVLLLSIFNILLDIIIIFVPAKSMAFRLPKLIIFDLENDLIISKIVGLNERIKPVKKRISKIKKIIDNGEWYYIKFKGDITENIVCQKNLLKTGTLEQFEEIFKDKILKK